jgi:hypothetical protein
MVRIRYAKFFDDFVSGPFDEKIEEDYVEIEEEIPIGNSYKGREWDFSGEKPVWRLIPFQLDQVKERANSRIDHKEIFHYTLTLEKEYEEVRKEATDFINNVERSYPLLLATVNAGRNATLLDAAVEVKQMVEEYLMALAYFRERRLYAKQQIAIAQTEEEVEDVLQSFFNSLPSGN